MNFHNEQDASTPATARFRSARRCLAWLVLVLISLVILLVRNMSIETVLILLFTLFALESLATEALGVSVDWDGITIPRKILPQIPWMVLWRQRLFWEEIERVNSLSDHEVRLITASARTDTSFRDREEKLEFFRAVKHFNPSIRIQRGS